MSTTVKIFRNLLALRSCRNVFSLKYCTSQKDDKDSGVKHDVDDNSVNEALARGDQIIPQGPHATPSSSDSDPDSSHDDKVEDKEKGSFKNFMTKIASDSIYSSEVNSPISEAETFVSLLRKSPLMELGDPVGKLVVGTIDIIHDEYAYIDFGWKFPTVCPINQSNAEEFKPGSKVIIKIQDLELSTKFLGDEVYTSLLEADCTLVSLYKNNVVS